MVNANIVISVSAILVAVVLTIVFVLRQNNSGVPDDNYSVSANGVTQDGSPAAMYFCVGDKCQFYDMDYELDDFPGFFALVGYSAGGETFLTEHSVGFTFKYDSSTGNLLDCYHSQSLDGALVSQRVADLMATSGSVYTVDGMTWSGDVTWSSDLSIVPSVLGFTVPTPKDCQAAKFVPGVDHDPSLILGPDVDYDPTLVFPASRRLEEGERELAYTRTLRWSLSLAATAYDGVVNKLGENNQELVKECKQTPGGEIPGSALAYIVRDVATDAYALTFAGSNDLYDWLQNAKISPLTCDSWYYWRSSKPYYCSCRDTKARWSSTWVDCALTQKEATGVHKGFWEYEEALWGCVSGYLNNQFVGKNLELITGHSLGGAAATLIKKLHSNYPQIKNAKLVTWAAPKTSPSSCSIAGERYFHENDIVTSNMLGALGSFNHDVTAATQFFTDSNNRKSKRDPGCGAMGLFGCTWKLECNFSAIYHNLSGYLEYVNANA